MKNYKKMPFNEEQYKIINGDSLVVLETFHDNYFDACITDPPYGLTTITKRFGKSNSKPATTKNNDGSFARLSKGFMGKEWDGSGIEYNVDFWSKVYAKLKPGAYLLAFGGSRTFHRIACAIEDAGFEIRDTIMWLYGSGFPKSMNIGLAIDKKNGVESQIVGKGKSGKSSHTFQSENTTTAGEFDIRKATNKWDGWGTALKPAYEPIIVARKSVEKSVIENIEKYGVGGINIDECRVGNETIKGGTMPKMNSKSDGINIYNFGKKDAERIEREDSIGRFPANVILTYDESDEKEVCGGMPYTKGNNPNEFGDSGFWFDDGKRSDKQMSRGYDDNGSAARYFYCAKASKKDRDSGLALFEEKTTGELQGGRKEGSLGSMMPNEDGTTRLNPYAGSGAVKKNIHPTVKPVELMQYLIRLVCPYGATILDPFNGSGSTGKAVAFENREREKDYRYVGIELDKEYCEISKGRIDYALNKFEYDMIQDIKEKEQKTGQLSLFDIPTD